MDQAEHIAAAVTGAVAAGQVPGAAWRVDRRGEVLVDFLSMFRTA